MLRLMGTISCSIRLGEDWSEAMVLVNVGDTEEV